MPYSAGQIGPYVTAAWSVLGTLLIIFSMALATLSPRFGYEFDVAEMPVLPVVAGLAAAGLVYASCLPALITATTARMQRDMKRVLAIMVVAGFAARLVMFASTPILEDDYQRYLWDGAVTASGHNPYSMSPADARAIAYG